MTTPSNSDKLIPAPSEQSVGGTEPQRNRETEQRRIRASEKKRNKETEQLTIQTSQMIPPLAARVATLPQAVEHSIEGGFKENSIFIFCRALKAFEVTRKGKLSLTDQDSAFALWWRTVKKDLPTDANFDEYRFIFLDTFERTRAPLGANPLHEAIRRADSQPAPPEAKCYESTKIKRLVAVCHQLQLLAGASPLFLGVRDAAKIAETKKLETAAALLAGIVRDGILTVIKKGEPNGHQATRFRYNQQQSGQSADLKQENRV